MPSVSCDRRELKVARLYGFADEYLCADAAACEIITADRTIHAKSALLIKTPFITK